MLLDTNANYCCTLIRQVTNTNLAKYTTVCGREAVTMLGPAISAALAEMLHRPSEIESLIE